LREMFGNLMEEIVEKESTIKRKEILEDFSKVAGDYLLKLEDICNKIDEENKIVKGLEENYLKLENYRLYEEKERTNLENRQSSINQELLDIDYESISEDYHKLKFDLDQKTDKVNELSHLMEQYFSGTDNNTTDYVIEGLLRSVIDNARVALKNPKDYEARSNIMWSATLALNTMAGLSKTEDWEVHMIEHQVGAYTDCAHGMGLATISIPYYRHIYSYGLDKFVRFAKEVWNVQTEGKTKDEIAQEGLSCLEAFIKECGMVTSLRELGATKEMLPLIANSTILLDSGYKKLTAQEVLEILEKCY